MNGTCFATLLDSNNLVGIEVVLHCVIWTCFATIFEGNNLSGSLVMLHCFDLTCLQLYWIVIVQHLGK